MAEGWTRVKFWVRGGLAAATGVCSHEVGTGVVCAALTAKELQVAKLKPRVVLGGLAGWHGGLQQTGCLHVPSMLQLPKVAFSRVYDLV